VVSNSDLMNEDADLPFVLAGNGEARLKGLDRVGVLQ